MIVKKTLLPVVRVSGHVDITTSKSKISCFSAKKQEILLNLPLEKADNLCKKAKNDPKRVVF